MLRACVLGLGGNWEEHLPLIEFAYNNSFHASISMAPYEALYGRRCRSPICWDEVGERKLLGPELVQVTGIDPPVDEPSASEDSTGEEETSSESASSSAKVSNSEFGKSDSSFNIGMSMKFDIDKFDGYRDFGIWRRKVKAFLSQQKILKAIEGPGKLHVSLNEEQKSDMLEMALGTIILNLSDNVLREMDASKGLSKNLDEFKKMTIELANAGIYEKLNDENEAIILLNSLPESFKGSLKSKELELKSEKKDSGENLFAWGRQPVKSYNNNSSHKNKSRSKTPSNNRLSFTLTQHTTKQVLEYIHSNLWGPAKVPTHGGSRYFLSLVDDYSRKVWIYLLKTKDQAFDSFKAWKKLVENQTSKKVKTLRTDNGLEFFNEEFNKFCSDEGILRHRTEDRAAHSDGMHQVGESQNQPEINDSLADYELVRDRARRIIKPNGKFSYADVISFALCTG
ncbi:hypothetical protein EZV62_019419 [Acer yangbiense]|uniref:Integrase catalytic domain-containing protein n=1 Tax=Acer yangbiense TaxID=1000413 RepID=A0A5C7HAA5_9ROSI|nr:hypothetical protein EZV62_019419 [Acer yangbiense]